MPSKRDQKAQGSSNCNGSTGEGNLQKPCWSLGYCPYGELVEQFPLLPSTRAEATEHNEFLKKQLAAGAYDPERRARFEKQVAEFNPTEYPEENLPAEIARTCSVYGHQCPVFYAASFLCEFDGDD